jgi:hypothetical protein
VDILQVEPELQLEPVLQVVLVVLVEEEQGAADLGVEVDEVKEQDEEQELGVVDRQEVSLQLL